MKLLVVAVGARQPDWVNLAFDEYVRRMPPHLRIELAAVKPDTRTAGRSVAQMVEVEAARIEAALPRGCTRIVLDEHGRSMTTPDLARRLETWLASGNDAAFVIGGPDGTAPRLRSAADLQWSLSPLTLPHGLARVVLAEQLYRAWSILHNHPYHRE